MNNDVLLTKKIIALEIIQTIIQHSDDNYLLRVALTQKLRDLLSCRFVIFVQYNIFSVNEDILSYEISPDDFSRTQLKRDLEEIHPELLKLHTCRCVENFHNDLESFSKYSHTIMVPITHQNQHIGTILIFDVTKLYDTQTILESFESLISYISIVLFNSISYHQMENIINIRTTELKKAIKEVNDTNKSKSLFLANMSHEMRTPLNGIIGYLDLLKREETDHRKLDYLNKIDTASHSLLHLISSILDLSKLEFEHIELTDTNFDLQKVVEDVVSLHMKKATQKGLRLRIQMKGFPSEAIIGDSERFKQILNNLISNSIKFTQKGTIDVIIESELNTIKLDDEVIEQRVKVMCDVIDSGIGIHEANIGKIFEVFTQEDATTTRKYGGSGLGLAITRKLIELMDGEIHVESVVGQGSVFSFYLYFDVEVSTEISLKSLDDIRKESYKNKAIPTNIDYSQMKVLVVEDNEINSNLIGEILKLREIYPDFAINGNEATIKSKKTKYDLILMDCQMPIMDGYQATRRIRLQYDDTIEPYDKSPHIIALTAAVSETDKKRCFDAGMNDYLSKPIDLEAIFHKIDIYTQKHLDT